jgi:hypothetical protein
VIAGNATSGIDVGSAADTVVAGNAIGFAPDLVSPMGNGGDGVYVYFGSARTSIGTTAANWIGNNASAGVRVDPAAGNRNAIRGNVIVANGGLGIDLAGGGVTPNDAGDADGGPNDQQNFPILDPDFTGGTEVAGTLDSTASTTFVVEVFSVTACDASGNGEGAELVGTASVGTNGGGHATFTVPLSRFVDASSEHLTATATDPLGARPSSRRARRRRSSRRPRRRPDDVVDDRDVDDVHDYRRDDDHVHHPRQRHHDHQPRRRDDHHLDDHADSSTTSTTAAPGSTTTSTTAGSTTTTSTTLPAARPPRPRRPPRVLDHVHHRRARSTTTRRRRADHDHLHDSPAARPPPPRRPPRVLDHVHHRRARVHHDLDDGGLDHDHLHDSPRRRDHHDLDDRSRVLDHVHHRRARVHHDLDDGGLDDDHLHDLAGGATTTTSTTAPGPRPRPPPPRSGPPRPRRSSRFQHDHHDASAPHGGELWLPDGALVFVDRCRLDALARAVAATGDGRRTSASGSAGRWPAPACASAPRARVRGGEGRPPCRQLRKLAGRLRKVVRAQLADGGVRAADTMRSTTALLLDDTRGLAADVSCP